MKVFKYLITPLIVILFISCNINSENTEKKLINNNWLLETYIRNGADETDQITISKYREYYYNDGTFERSYLDIESALIEETGSWSFKNDKKEIHVSDISSIRDFSPNNSTLSSSVFHIVELSDIQFKYSFQNGGDNHDFRFIQE